MSERDEDGAVRAPIDWEAGLERLRGAYADRTLEECAYEFRRFRVWCRRVGACPLPAEPETIARVVDHYFEACTVRTVESRLWHLRRMHLANGLSDPTRTEAVRLAFRRGARAHGARRSRSRSRQAAPVNAALRDRLRALCPDSLMGTRDRAMLSLAYDTLCRQSELVALRIEDMTPLPDGSARILVQRSKSDPFGRGEAVYLSPRGLADVQAWLARAGIDCGCILRRIHFRTKVGRVQMGISVVRERVRHLAGQAGLDPELIRGLSGHSMRVGAAHDLAVSGRTLPEIMRAGRWRSLEAAALYLREAPINVWTEDPAAGVAAGGRRGAYR